METSESIKNISAALLAFHKIVPTISKESKNPFFKSSYADLPTILKAINPALQASELVVMQFPEGENALTTRLIHSSGEWMQATYIMKPVKNTPQDTGSAITYQRRYAIGAILNLDIDNDDDGNAASGKTEEKKNGNTPTADDKPWLNENTEQFTKAVGFLSANGDIKKIEGKYRISKKVREALLTAAV